MSHAQAEGVCLKYPEDLAYRLKYPFSGRILTDPLVFLIFVPNQMPFPLDGIRYQDQEQRYTIPVGSTRELEVSEIKFGFIPGHDSAASRIRRRYRMIKGGHPQLVLIHYSRGQSIPIVPSLNQPIRSYPLRPMNEPAVYVIGPRQGQKVHQNGAASGPMPGPDRGMPPIGFGDPQAMLAQRNNAMEALERRNRAERERSGSMAGRSAPQSRADEDDSADESEMISVRNLALARYRRNHEFMSSVFNQAAFGKHVDQPEIKPAYSIFKTEDLESDIGKLEAEIEGLRAAAEARKAAREANELADTSMEIQTDGIAV